MPSEIVALTQRVLVAKKSYLCSLLNRTLRKMKLLLIASLVLVGVAILLLCIKIILLKDGRFPNTHVGGQKAMQDRGISCHTSQDKQKRAHRTLQERLDEAAKE